MVLIMLCDTHVAASHTSLRGVAELKSSGNKTPPQRLNVLGRVERMPLSCHMPSVKPLPYMVNELVLPILSIFMHPRFDRLHENTKFFGNLADMN